MEINNKKESEVMYKDTKLNVQYFSQYLDIHDGKLSPRACGITSAYMVLKYFGADVTSLEETVKNGIQEGGYGSSGWKHDYIVNLFHTFGYTCERKENMRDRDIDMFVTSIKNGDPVIVSVMLRLWDQRLFHMVVLTGVRENKNGELEGFFYHDPASLRENGAQHFYVSVPTFFLDWRRMAIFPSRKI